MNNNEQQFSLDAFSPKHAELTELRESTSKLTIKGLDDKEGYKLVFEAKNKLVKARTGIDKTEKELTENAREYVNKVREAKKSLLAIIEPEELRLKEELQKIEDEKERLAEEKREADKIKFQKRLQILGEIKHIPDNMFAIGSMTDEEFDAYHQTKLEEYNKQIVIDTGLNLINSCNTLNELEELHHDEVFLQTYDSPQFKEAFEKRFNDLNEEQKRKQQQEIIKNISAINSCNSLSDLEELVWHENEDIKSAYSNRKQFLEQQEELRVMREEKEEQDRQQKLKEQEEQKKKQLEEQEKEKRKKELVDDIYSCQTEEELRILFYKETIQDLIPDTKHIFSQRKEVIIKNEEESRKKKEFQEYLQSIGYNEKDCVIKDNGQQTLIYKLIGTWNK